MSDPERALVRRVFGATQVLGGFMRSPVDSAFPNFEQLRYCRPGVPFCPQDCHFAHVQGHAWPAEALSLCAGVPKPGSR